MTTMVEKKNDHFYKTVGFVYTWVMNFINPDNLIGPTISVNFLNSVNCLIHTKRVIHYSHKTGKVIGYT